MMHAVIRNDRNSLHLIGHVDAYNLESLRDHAQSMGRRTGLSLVIELSPSDEQRLTNHAGRWLDRLSRAGVPVVVRTNTRPLG